MLKFREKHNWRKFFLLLPIIFFGIFLSLLIIVRSQSYIYYERVEFECADKKIYANLYHPTNDLDFQEKYPLVIYVHGFSSQKDNDPRIPLELTKRGFYVAAVDNLGHGESADSHLLNEDEDGELAMTQLCSKLLDKIEKLDCYRQIDEDQIGLIGHSLGGYVVLMNGLYDDRFKVTVTWAGVTDIMKAFKEFENAGYEFDKDKKELLHDNNPVEVMNNGSNQPDNLLLIVHKEDYWYKYNKRLQSLTNCEIEKFDYHVSNSGEAHLLLHRSVMIETITWFEKEFFDSTNKNGPIQLSYGYYFLLLFLTLISSCFTIFSLMIYSSKFILVKKELKVNEELYGKKSELPSESHKKKQIIIFSFSIPIFISIWIVFTLLSGLLAPWVASCAILLIYLLFLRRVFRKMNTEQEKKSSFKDSFKSETLMRSLTYAAFCSAIYLAFYFTFALFCPYYLYYPHNFVAVIIAFTYIPLYLSTEVFYRKILYPSSGFLKSKKMRTFIITIMTGFTQTILSLLVFQWLIQVIIVTMIAFIVTSLMNGIIYHKTENLGATFLNSFIIMSVFYGATWSYILNLLSMTI